ncbi:MAG: hypothetical protein E7618_02505 [Ruminococcaceae bacterium]|nr:hypothetical protein [Oscillospiraceae bacterium]
MLICKKCKAIITENTCPLCGKTKGFITPKENDLVYLTSAEYLWSPPIEDALLEAGVGYSRVAIGGTESVIGQLTEFYRYYVSLADYERAFEALPPENSEMTEEELNAYIDSLADETEQ